MVLQHSGAWRYPQRSAECGSYALDGLGERGLARTEVQPHEAASWCAEPWSGFECDAVTVEEHTAWLLATADASAVQRRKVGRLGWLLGNIG
jgi:hypothetical protein